MRYLSNLVLSRPYFERIYDSTLVVDQGKRYEFIATTRGKSYLFAYTYTGRSFTIAMGKISGSKVHATWYNPRNGAVQEIGTMYFQPPGSERNGNDWVLVLDDSSKGYSNPEYEKIHAN
jgi:hypothetical protein